MLIQKVAIQKTIGHGMLTRKGLEELLVDIKTTLNNRPQGMHGGRYTDQILWNEKDPDNIEEKGLRKRVPYLTKCKTKSGSGGIKTECLKSHTQHF